MGRITQTERTLRQESNRHSDWRLWAGSRFVRYTAVAIFLLGFAVVMFYKEPVKTTETVPTLELSGRIESPETRIGVTRPARVKTVLAKEGDFVSKDEVLLTLDDEQKEKKTVAVNAGYNAAMRQRQKALQQLNEARRAAVAAKQEKRGFFATIFAPLTGAKKKEAAMRAQLAGQISRAQAAVAEADRAIAAARAKRKRVQTDSGDERITSPIDGICIVRSVQPGEVVAPGQTLLTIINPKEAYMRGYVPEGELGKVRIGQKAQVYLDSDPENPLKARVTSIDTVASFTPENVYLKEDRVKQVFGVKLNIDNRYEQAKPGMPADGRIILSKTESWR